MTFTPTGLRRLQGKSFENNLSSSTVRLSALSLHPFNFLSPVHSSTLSPSFPFTWRENTISPSLRALITVDRRDETALAENVLGVLVIQRRQMCFALLQRTASLPSLDVNYQNCQCDSEQHNTFLLPLFLHIFFLALYKQLLTIVLTKKKDRILAKNKWNL